MLIAFCLVFALGLTIAGLERTSVINNWSSRRCELPVVVSGMFFKPNSDSRTKSQFAKDNFDFCMKSYVDKFMNLLFAPINAIFGKQANVAGSAIDMVNTIRTIAQTLYNTLSTYLEQYYRKFTASVYEMSRVVQYLRMAMNRANAMAMSMLYSGITLLRGMLNTIQFIIKVILIICGIMLAIIIILIFVLFPVIPIIVSTLGAIIVAVISLSIVISEKVADEASSDRSGFCFSEDTQVLIKEEDGTEKRIDVKDIGLGTELGSGYGRVTSVIKMDGNNVQMYDVNGIIVSGSHLIKGTDNIWKSVASDERSKKTDIKSKVLYCFNTTSNVIPVYSRDNTIILFRDWEEIDKDDIKGQYNWNYTILSLLNKNSNYYSWKDSLNNYSDIQALGSKVKVKTTDGYIEISKIELFSNKIVDRNGKTQKVLGVITSEINGLNDDGIWNTSLCEINNGTWIKGKSSVIDSDIIMNGCMLITETGEFIIWDEQEEKEKIIRDFTEVGYNEIYKTYSFVESRLRS